MTTKPVEYHNGLLWYFSEGETLILGVTQAGIDRVGTVDDVDFAEPGDEFDEGDWVGEVQGKDFVVEVVAPFPLVVREQNRDLREQPALLEDDPTGDAWILRVEKKAE